MTTQTALEIESLLPATFTAPGLSEEEFLELCEKFPDAFLEYTADGTVIVMPPTDPESGVQNGEVFRQLADWAKQQGLGMVSGPDAGFLFQDGSRRSPDAAWFDEARWREARQRERRRRFPVFAPEFVIEIRSPDDRLRPLQEKMEEYIANGVQLGWLIDPKEGTVTIYSSGAPPRALQNPPIVEGEGPVAGFILNLEQILNRVG
jgi:Uma2 family endonuclease